MRIPETTYFDLATNGRILVVTIKNPPDNYLCSESFRELYECRECFESPEVDAVLITGYGHVFSKGVDVSELTSQAGSLDAETVLYGNEAFTFISALRKPVIAAINGACLGGGLELALACDIRVSSERARLGLPELAIGLIPGLGGIARLVRVVGEAKALELILLGDFVTSATAMELNLVSRVFPRKNFHEKALRFTRAILTAPNETIRDVLDLVALSRKIPEEEAIQRAAERFARLMSAARQGVSQPATSAALGTTGRRSAGGVNLITKLAGYEGTD